MMKKPIFTFLTLIVLAFANSAFAQTSVTPYLGAAYNYSVTGLDGPDVSRTVRIYFTTDAAPGTLLTPGTENSITISNVTNEDGSNNDQGSVSGDYHVFTLDNSSTEVNFDATFGTSLTASTDYRIWIEVFEGDNTTCSNMMYLSVTPSENTLDFGILAANETQCPATTIPTAEKTDAVDESTEIVYTISRTDGNSNYNWSFQLAINPTQFGPSSENVTVAYSVTGGTVTGSGFNSEIVVSGTETVTATITVTNNPGTANTDFIATISDMKQYFNQTNTVNSESDNDGDNNEDTTTLQRIPSIGNFTGN